MCSLHSLSQPVTSCTQNGTKHNIRNVKVMMFVMKNPLMVLLFAGPVRLKPQSGAIFARKVK